MKAKAFAKINLSLDIVGKRADGYHLLRTVMQSVSLYDTVWAEKDAGISLSCTAEGVPLDEKNTAVRAARVFFSETGISGGVQLKIEKKIPMQAGLGGGSADAAAVLRLLDALYETKLSTEALCRMGEAVGADVPFCVRGGAALAEGIGEKLTPLKPMPACNLVIVRPQEGVCTAAAYALIDRLGQNIPETTDQMLCALREGVVPKIGNALFNVFDYVSNAASLPAIKAVMKAFGAFGACMSGSGSAVYGIFAPDDLHAEQCRKALQAQYGTAFLCHPVGE